MTKFSVVTHKHTKAIGRNITSFVAGNVIGPEQLSTMTFAALRVTKGQRQYNRALRQLLPCTRRLTNHRSHATIKRAIACRHSDTFIIVSNVFC